ncbi:MAG: regulatory protein RecX [Clostridia bacterium]|nr:regulatory protein RecX [Clostridia bacterium]
MIITSIKKSKKGNILIYADNNYLASVLPEVFLKSGLKIGSYIDDEILESLNEEINLNKAKEKALRLLSFRAHSKHELKNKIKNSLGEKYAEKAAEKMENLGLVNDKEFAFLYAKELFFKKLYSIKRVKYELTKKGVENNIIEETLSKIDINEEENIKKIFLKKHTDKNTTENEKELRKLVSYCQRLGYSWSVINSAINELEEN